MYKTGIKHVFYWWMQRDMKKYMNLLESKSLIEKMENNQFDGKKQETLSFIEQIKRSIWEYGAFLARNTYAEGQDREGKHLIDEEAEDLTEDLKSSFLTTAYGEKSIVQQLFPKYSFSFDTYFNDETGNDNFEDESIYLALFMQLKEWSKGKSFDQLLQLIQGDRTVQRTIQMIVEEIGISKRWSVTPTANHYLVFFFHLLKQAIHDIRFYSEKHGIAFEKDAETRCFYNVLNLYIHYLAVHGKIKLSMKEREVIFAAAALHPVQDDYLDHSEVTEDVKNAIEDKLKGESVPFINDEADKIFRLIDIIYNKFPVKKHPYLLTIFEHLHYYQCESEKQKEIGIEEEELLDVTFMKGGYAFAFFGYIAQGEMTIPQFSHYFTMGAIFQVLDDFHDVEEDMENGTQTVWTKAINRGENIDAVFDATIKLQLYYEQYTSVLENFNYPVIIRKIELFGIRYDVLRFYSMHQGYFSPTFKKEMEDCFPFPMENVRKVFQSTYLYESLDTIDEILTEGEKMLTD